MADTSVGSGSVIPGLDGNFSGNGIVRKDVYNDEEHGTIIQSSYSGKYESSTHSTLTTEQSQHNMYHSNCSDPVPSVRDSKPDVGSSYDKSVYPVNSSSRSSSSILHSHLNSTVSPVTSTCLPPSDYPESNNASLSTSNTTTSPSCQEGRYSSPDRPVSNSYLRNNSSNGLTEKDITDTSSRDGQNERKRLHISNIPFKYRENDLMQLFQGYGEIVDIEIIFNDRGSKGFGFVTLADSELATKARVELNGKVVDGRKIEINEATPRTGPPKSKSLRGPWSSSSSSSRNGPYGGNYQYAFQYHNNRGGYRSGGGGGGQSGQYPVTGGYGYQQHGYQDYGGYNYQNYGPSPPPSNQQGWSHQPYNYSTGYNTGTYRGSTQSHEYRYSPY